MQPMEMAGTPRQPVFPSVLATAAVIAAMLIAMISLMNEAGAAEKTIHLGVPPHGWPPYIIVRHDRICGIAVDVVSQIGTNRGFVLKTRLYPEKRAHKMVERGKLDAWPDAKEWSSTPQRYLWTDPMVESEDRLICRENAPIAFDRTEDLFGKTIGTHLGYYYPRFECHFADKSMIRADTHGEAAMLKMLLLGRTDAAVINQLVAMWVIKTDPRLQQSDFTFSRQVVDRAGYRIMFTRKHAWETFIDDFNTDLEAMKRDGRLDRIISQYR